MAWRRMTVRLLVAPLVVLTLVPQGAAEPRSGEVRRLEFEAPPAVERPGPVMVTRTLRGVMGYRQPLVSRQQVPGQVVSGVLIPAHTTYVILQPGHWELVGLSPVEVEALRVADKADEPAVHAESPARRWNPLRLFRRSGGK